MRLVTGLPDRPTVSPLSISAFCVGELVDADPGRHPRRVTAGRQPARKWLQRPESGVAGGELRHQPLGGAVRVRPRLGHFRDAPKISGSLASLSLDRCGSPRRHRHTETTGRHRNRRHPIREDDGAGPHHRPPHPPRTTRPTAGTVRHRHSHRDTRSAPPRTRRTDLRSRPKRICLTKSAHRYPT